jgi:hypothetical protein
VIDRSYGQHLPGAARRRRPSRRRVLSGGGQGFDASIVHYPGGDLNAPEDVVAVVDRDMEDAGGIGDGEGRRIDTLQSVKFRRSAIVSLPIDVSVTETSGTETGQPSVFEFDDYRWRTVRIIGRDEAMQDVLVTRLDKKASRRTSRT